MSITNNDQVGIIGYGRFGKLLHSILKPDYPVFINDPQCNPDLHPHYLPLEKIIQCSTLFLCIPIHQMEPLLIAISGKLQSKLVIDTCSVKVYPCQWMLKHLPASTQLIATHPMFGPDSYPQQQPSPMMMHQLRVEENIFNHWQHYFSQKNIIIHQLSPEEHDQQCAFSQNITHIIGRMLGQLKPQQTALATKGYLSLQSLVRQTCHDSIELFHDMLHYNPYSKAMLQQLDKAFQTTLKTIK